MNTKILKNPRITEKASTLLSMNVYTFDVLKSANKTEISKAILELYKVRPVKINILPIRKKKTFSRGIVGSKGGGKKVLVYLKKGDEIKFV